MAQGMAQGIAQGVTQGVAQGAVEEARRLLLAVGRKKFGAPNEIIRTSVDAVADRDRLEQLFEARHRCWQLAGTVRRTGVITAVHDPRIYLDHAATTPVLPEVWDAMRAVPSGNPASAHAAGRYARRALEDARERVADLLGAEPGEVIFTSGATEANNLALFGLAGDLPGHIVAGSDRASMCCRAAEPTRGSWVHGGVSAGKP